MNMRVPKLLVQVRIYDCVVDIDDNDGVARTDDDGIVRKRGIVLS